MDEDPYVYPGTETLKNLLNLRDPDELREAEYRATNARHVSAISAPLTVQGFQTLHRHLFEEIYDWAGVFRTIDITKEFSTFCRAQFIAPQMDALFRKLPGENHLNSLSRPEFAAMAADHISELNAIHPFREGNGRTMMLHLEQLGQKAAHEIDLLKLDAGQWKNASIAAFNGSNLHLALVIGKTMQMNNEEYHDTRDALAKGHGR